MREKDMDAYNFYIEELQKNGYVSGDKDWFLWVAKRIREKYPEAIFLDFSFAGMGCYIIIQKPILFELEKMVCQNYIRKQKELFALEDVLIDLRVEERS